MTKPKKPEIDFPPIVTGTVPWEVEQALRQHQDAIREHLTRQDEEKRKVLDTGRALGPQKRADDRLQDEARVSRALQMLYEDEGIDAALWGFDVQAERLLGNPTRYGISPGDPYAPGTLIGKIRNLSGEAAELVKAARAKGQ